MSELTDTIDQRLGARFAEIASAQASFFAAHGRYCQLTATHSSVPENGEFEAPDRETQRVTDGAAWNDLGELPAEMQSSLEIEVYSGPRGNGFVVLIEVVEGGVLLEKRVNVGPENERGHGWRARENGEQS